MIKNSKKYNQKNWELRLNSLNRIVYLINTLILKIKNNLFLYFFIIKLFKKKIYTFFL